MRRDLVTGQIMIKFSNRSILPLKLKKDQSHDELALVQFIHERRSDGPPIKNVPAYAKCAYMSARQSPLTSHGRASQ